MAHHHNRRVARNALRRSSGNVLPVRQARNALLRWVGQHRRVDVDDHRVLNPANVKRIRRPYGIELYIPAGAEPEFVLPYAEGWCNVSGERVR